MTFVQLIEFRTTDIDGMRQIHEEWLRATDGTRTARRQLLTRDRSDPDRYVVIAFFDSYESAMENSSLPETQASAEQYQKITDGPPAFHDLIVLDESN